jgi:hypothetical protein
MRWIHWKELVFIPGMYMVQPLESYGCVIALDVGNCLKPLCEVEGLTCDRLN